MEARQACAKPTVRMIVKETAGISRKMNKNREHDVIEEEDPAGGSYMVKFVGSLSLIRIKVKFTS